MAKARNAVNGVVGEERQTRADVGGRRVEAEETILGTIKLAAEATANRAGKYNRKFSQLIWIYSDSCCV